MASNSEGSDSGVDPPTYGTQVLDLNNQFEQQQSAINELKEGLRKNEQQMSGKGKELEEYASKLNSIKSRSRASNRSPRPGAGPGPSPRALAGTPPPSGALEPTAAPHKDAEKLTPSKSLLLLRQKVNENKLILEQRGREQTESKRGVAVMVEQLKTQLEERDSTIQLLQTKLSSPDVAGRLHHATGAHASLDAARKHLSISQQASSTQIDGEEAVPPVHNGKVAELSSKVVELQGVIVGLQENLLEKDSVINARTKAIALMSEDLCRKGKTTLDRLEETKEEMRLMQNKFIQIEADMNKEKADLCEQLELKEQRLHQLEETNSELATIRNELSARVSELQNSRAKSSEDTAALAEANKQIVKLKAQTKKQLKQLNSLKKDSADGTRITDLENKIAELEEEKGNLQLHLVDFDDLKVSECNSLERLTVLEDELNAKASLVEEMMLKLASIPELELEKQVLEERVTRITEELEQMKLTKVLAELKSVQLEEDVDIITREKLHLEEMLAAKIAALEYVPEKVQKALQPAETQTSLIVTMENFTQTLLESLDVALQTLDEKVLESIVSVVKDLSTVSTQTSLETVEREIQTVTLQIQHLTAELDVSAADRKANWTQTHRKEFKSLATQTSGMKRSTSSTQTKNQKSRKSSEDMLAEQSTVTPLNSVEADASLKQLEALRADNDKLQVNISEYETTVSVMQLELLALQEAVVQTKAQLESQAAEFIIKDKHIENLSSNVMALETTIEQGKRELEALSAKNCLQVEKLKKLAINLRARNTQLHSCEEELKELKARIGERDSSILELETEKKNMNKTMQNLGGREQELAAQWDADKLQLENMVRNYAELEQVHQQFKEESTLRINETENTISSISIQLSAQQKEFEQLKSILQEREGYIQTLLLERKSHDLEFEQRKSILQEREGYIKTLLQERESRDLEFEQRKSILQEREGYIQTLLQERESRDLEFEQRKSILQDREGYIQTLLQERESHDLEFEQRKSILQEREGYIQTLLQERESLDVEFEQRKSILQEREGYIQTLLQERESLDVEFEQRKSILQEREGYIQTLLQERESHDSEFRLSMETVRKQIAEYQEQMSLLQELCSRGEAEAEAAEQTRMKLESDLLDARQMASEVENRLHQTLAAKDAKLEEQQGVLEEQGIEFMAMREKIERVENNLYEETALVEKLRSDNDELRGLCKQSEISAYEFENIRSSLEQRLAESDFGISTLQTKLQEQEGNFMESKEIVEDLRSQVLKLQKMLDGAQKKLDALIVENNRLSNVEQEYNISSAKLVNAESELKRSAAIHSHEKNHLTEELDKASSNIETIYTRLDGCEGNRRELSAKCDELTLEKAALEQEIEELNHAARKQGAQVEELTACLENLKKFQQRFEDNESKWVAAEQDLRSQLSEALARNEQLKELLAKSGILEDVCLKEVSSIISAAQAQLSQTPEEDADPADPDWGWGTEDALLEEMHQHQTSQSVSLLETEVKALSTQNSDLAEDLKNAQALSAKLVKKIKELKSQNNMLLSQINTSSNSLDQTMEIEFVSQISNLEKDVLALKIEKDALTAENHKLSTKVEALLWQHSELQEDKLRLAEEVEWMNKTVMEKDSKLCKLKLMYETKSETVNMATNTVCDEQVETKDSAEDSNAAIIQGHEEDMNRYCENLKQELEAREKEIVDLRNSFSIGNKQLESVSELEKCLREEIHTLKQDLSARVSETNRLSHVLLDQEKNLFEANSKFLARDRDAVTLETHLEIKNSEIEALSQELREHLNVIQLLKAVGNNSHPDEPAASGSEQRSERSERSERPERPERPAEMEELDHALYRLHQKEVRCDELTIELMQLLEERDTLQLRLSVALRANEDLKVSSRSPLPLPKSLAGGDSAQNDSTWGDSDATVSATSEAGQGALADKLDQVRSVGREQRQMALQQQQRGDVVLDANYMPREPETEQESFFEWIWGRSTPKVMHI